MSPTCEGTFVWKEDPIRGKRRYTVGILDTLSSLSVTLAVERVRLLGFGMVLVDLPMLVWNDENEHPFYANMYESGCGTREPPNKTAVGNEKVRAKN